MSTLDAYADLGTAASLYYQNKGDANMPKGVATQAKKRHYAMHEVVWSKNSKELK